MLYFVAHIWQTVDTLAQGNPSAQPVMGEGGRKVVRPRRSLSDVLSRSESWGPVHATTTIAKTDKELAWEELKRADQAVRDAKAKSARARVRVKAFRLKSARRRRRGFALTIAAWQKMLDDSALRPLALDADLKAGRGGHKGPRSDSLTRKATVQTTLDACFLRPLALEEPRQARCGSEIGLGGTQRTRAH